MNPSLLRAADRPGAEPGDRRGPYGRALRVVYSGCKEKDRLEHLRAEPDDASLLAAVARGDLDSFQAFYQRYAGRVLSYARQLSRNRELAEDVTQEVFTAVWSKAGSFRPDRGDPAGWLYTMTRNRLIDHWRKAGAGAEHATLGEEHPAGRPEGVDVLLTVQQALSRVEPEQRRAIEMAYFGGFTYEETARRLELPVGTLKSRIRSGLKAMRSVLEAT